MKTWKQLLVIIVVTAAVLAVSGCHTVTPATVLDASLLVGKKNIFVVVSDRKDRGFRKEIERNLTARGFTVSSGSRNQLTADADLSLEYEDRWGWDMVMYPKWVKIAFYNAKTQELVGSAEYSNRGFHTFSDPPEITDELLGRIFGEPAGRYMD